MNAPHKSVTTSNASLIGGIVVAIASLALCRAVTCELGFDGMPAWALSLLVAAAAGVWTRTADL